MWDANDFRAPCGALFLFIPHGRRLKPALIPGRF